MAARTQHGTSVPVSLATMKSITGTLANLLKSVGPRCQQSLLCTSTGKVLATSDGITILNSMLLAHPVAKLITSSVGKHCDAWGDGVKTFVLYLHGALKTVKELAQKDSPCRERISLPASCLSEESMRSFCSHLASSLRKFSIEVLPGLLQRVCGNAIVLRSDVCSKSLRTHLRKVLASVLSPHFSSANTEFLAELLLKAVSGDPETLTSLESVFLKLTDLVDHFSSVKITVFNHSFTASQVLPGFLVQRDFAHQEPGLHSATAVRFILLQCGIEGNTSENAPEIIKLSSSEMARKALAVRGSNARNFLQKLKQAGVSLILSSQRIPDYVLTLCQTHGVSVVSFIEEEDVKYLELVCRKFSLHSSYDLLEESHIGTAVSVQRLIIGGKGYVHLRLQESSVPLSHLILCAPTEGMCQHLSQIVLKTLISVKACFADCPIGKKDPLASTGTSIASNGECLSNVLETTAFSVEQFVPVSAMSKVRNPVTPLSPCLHKNSTQNSSSGNSLSSEVLDSPTGGSSSRQDLVFCAIPGGGFFEFQLAQMLRDCSGHFRDETWGMASQVLHDALLTLPRQLLTCLHRHQVGRDRCFLEDLTRVKETLQAGHQCSLNKFGELVVSLDKGDDSDSLLALDALPTKVGLVLNVLQLLQQMLRIDSIISVRRVSAVDG